jgi:hypothetical protein
LIAQRQRIAQNIPLISSAALSRKRDSAQPQEKGAAIKKNFWSPIPLCALEQNVESLLGNVKY